MSCRAPPAFVLAAAPGTCRRRQLHGRRASHLATVRASAAMRTLYALDFDGVICDSVGESSLSGWKAAERLWPEVFSTPAARAHKARVLEDMRAVRPVVETGYENVVQVRLLLEGTPVDDMLARWSTLLPETMRRWQLDRGELVELFGSTRDAWMRNDLAGWLAPNRLYPGVADALRGAMGDPGADVSIVTTKQARFTHTLLRDLAGVDMPMERIYSQTVSGRPKTEVLARLAEQAAPGTRLVFVEDKLSTLAAVAKTPGFEAWELFLVTWGYNTQAERDSVAQQQRIRLLELPQFGGLMEGKAV